MTVIAVDADPLVYRSGFAAEEVEYHVDWIEETADEDVCHELIFPTMGAFNEYLAEQGMEEYKDVLFSIERVVKPEPVSFCLSTAKRTLRAMRWEAANTLKVPMKDVQVRLFLTGPGNFREAISKRVVYKGNRDLSHKPFHYQALRDYLTNIWGATVVTGMEADDAVSIAMKSGEAQVVATTDKDLNMVPGWHYDYAKKKMYHVDEPMARRFFWAQVLAGDPVDNIPGIYRLSLAAAHALVSGMVTRGLEEEDIWQEVLQHYRDAAEKRPERYPGGPEACALETARLVHMLDYPGQLWTPPGEPDDVIQGWDMEE